MSRWLEIAQDNSFSSDTLQILQKPAKRGEDLILKEVGCRECDLQKPARTCKKGGLGLSAGSDPAKSTPINKGGSDFLQVSAGLSGADENPINKGGSDFLQVSAGCRGKEDQLHTLPPSQPKPPRRGADGACLSALMDRFSRQVRALEVDGGQTRQRAVWMAALEVFALPDERSELFEGVNLKPDYRQVSIAIGWGVVITFHQNGRVAFHNGDKAKRANHA